MRSTALLVMALSVFTACSARNCDNDALRLVAAGGAQAGGSGAVGGIPGTGGAPDGGGGTGGVGGGPLIDDCNGNGIADEDLDNDPDNCGACDHVCGILGCDQGNCIIHQGTLPSGIAMVDDGGVEDVVFWAGNLWRGPRDESAVPEDVFDSQGLTLADILRLEIPGAPHFLSVGKAAGTGFWLVVKHEDLGPPVVTLNAMMSPIAETWHLANSGSASCWGAGVGGASYIECNVDRTTANTKSMAIEADVAGVAMAGNQVYWLDVNGKLFAALVDLVTGMPSNVVQLEKFPASTRAQIALHDSMIYAVTTGGIHRSPLLASMPTVDTDPVVSVPEIEANQGGDILRVGNAFYFTDAGPTTGVGARQSSLYRFDDNGELDVLYRSHAIGPMGYIATDGACIYFTATTDGAVLRRPLPGLPNSSCGR